MKTSVVLDSMAGAAWRGKLSFKTEEFCDELAGFRISDNAVIDRSVTSN